MHKKLTIIRKIAKIYNNRKYIPNSIDNAPYLLTVYWHRAHPDTPRGHPESQRQVEPTKCFLGRLMFLPERFLATGNGTKAKHRRKIREKMKLTTD